MKFHQGFISNSSSCSFIITNISKEEKTLVDFVKENPHIIEEFCKKYDWHKPEDGYNQESLIQSAEENNLVFAPGKETYCIMGDESGTIVGAVMDYMLRDGGSSPSFTWQLEEMLR
jgi:hypothetical protein